METNYAGRRRHRNQTKTDQHVTLPLQTLFGTVQQDELMSLSLFSTFNYFLNLMSLIFIMTLISR